jgi:hypothetical protein
MNRPSEKPDPGRHEQPSPSRPGPREQRQPAPPSRTPPEEVPGPAQPA